MKSQIDEEPAIKFSGEKYLTESDFDVPAAWTLFDREQVDAEFPDGRVDTLFYERWIAPATSEGLVISKMIGTGHDRSLLGNVHPAGATYLTVEKFVDPVDTETFKASTGRVERAEFATEEAAYTAASLAMEGAAWNRPINVVEEVVQTSPSFSVLAV